MKAVRQSRVDLVTMLSAALYPLLAAAVDAFVIANPVSDPNLQWILISALSLTFVIAFDGVLKLIGAIPDIDRFSWPLLAASIAAVAFSIVYGPSLFVNYWNYDDWTYLGWGAIPQTSGFLFAPLNDHFTPLLRLILWTGSRLFGLDYLWAACLQQTAFLSIVVVLAHFIWNASRRPWLLAVIVIPFAIWPSYGTARTWFAGGFWLTASAAFAMTYVLHARAMLLRFSQNQNRMRRVDWAISLTLASAAVFISSQTLAPVIYVVAFCLPLALQQGRPAISRLIQLSAASLIPTLLAFAGRTISAPHMPVNPSGFFDGKYIANLGIFILNKIFFILDYRWFLSIRAPQTAVLLFFLPIFCSGAWLLFRRHWQRNPDAAGELLCGSAIFLISIAQIGLARRWSYDAVLNTYYVTFPFFGMWLAWGSVLISWMPAKPPGAPHSRIAIGIAALASCLILAASLRLASAQRALEPDHARVVTIEKQRAFIRDLGGAVCELGRIHSNEPDLHWAAPQLPSCKLCLQIIGPPDFLASPVVFGSVASAAARPFCRNLPDSLLIADPKKHPMIRSTDGRESPAIAAFIQKYFDAASIQKESR